MKKLYAFLLTLLITTNLYSVDPKLDEPLDIRNQYAPTLLFSNPQMGSPILLPKNQFRFSANTNYVNDIKNSQFYAIKDGSYLQKQLLWGSFLRNNGVSTEQALLATDFIYFGHLENQFKTIVDMEYIHFNLKMEYGLTERIEIGAKASILSFQSGILDEPINLFHRLVGVSTGKEFLESNRFQYTLTGSTTTLIQSKPRTSLGDTDVYLKYDPTNGILGGIRFSINGGLKVPTGNTRYGMGSGRPDVFTGFVVMIPSEKLSHFVSVQGVYVSNPFHDLSIRARSYGIVAYNLNYHLKENIFPSIRLEVHSSPYSSNTLLLSQPSVVLSMGVNYSPTDATLFQIGFMEDLSFTATDITFFMNFKTFY